MLSLEDWLMIRELCDHGMSISEISRRLHIDRKTARKYAHFMVSTKKIKEGKTIKVYNKTNLKIELKK